MAILKGLFDIEVDLKKRAKIVEKREAAWKDQHAYIIKKWLNQAVFATPIPPQIDRPKIRIFGICKQRNFVA